MSERAQTHAQSGPITPVVCTVQCPFTLSLSDTSPLATVYAACCRYGSRASSTYAALIKQSLAGVRRAEALEIARGVASSRNRQRDARIASIRENRIGMEVSRSEQARQVRVHMCCVLRLLCLFAACLAAAASRLLALLG